MPQFHVVLLFIQTKLGFYLPVLNKKGFLSHFCDTGERKRSNKSWIVIQSIMDAYKVCICANVGTLIELKNKK